MEAANRIQIKKPLSCPTLNTLKTLGTMVLEQFFGFFALEGPDHTQSVFRIA